MPTREQIHDAYEAFGVDNVRRSEYKVEYIRTPTRNEPYHHYTFAWTRLYSLPEVRKKAMNMIRRGTVSPNSETHMRTVKEMSYWVMVSKDTPKGEVQTGIVVKVGDSFYWKGTRTGDFHIINPDGSIGTKSIKLPLPKPKIIKRMD